MTNILLLFFALPIATIIISIALQKVLDNPLLVAAIIFAIFLVVTFIIGDLNFLIATIVYTILSFLTAAIINYIEENREEENNNNNNQCSCRRR